MEKLELKTYTDFIMDHAVELLHIDSPTGYTEDAVAYVMQAFQE